MNGREIVEYPKLLAESREQAMERMIEDAQIKGSDGIVCIRFTTSSIIQSTSRIICL
jgi:uncharacterized protein YbjQ (UPF0145 family)